MLAQLSFFYIKKHPAKKNTPRNETNRQKINIIKTTKMGFIQLKSDQTKLLERLKLSLPLFGLLSDNVVYTIQTQDSYQAFE